MEKTLYNLEPGVAAQSIMFSFIHVACLVCSVLETRPICARAEYGMLDHVNGSSFNHVHLFYSKYKVFFLFL